MALDFNAPIGGTTPRKKRIAPNTPTAQTAAPGTQLAQAAVPPQGQVTEVPFQSNDIGGAAARSNPTMGDDQSFKDLAEETRRGGVNAVDITGDPAEDEYLEDPIQIEGDFVDKPEADIDQLMEDYIRAQFEAAQNVDTSAGEALITQQMLDQIGAGRTNNRAAMGAGGWGQSGMAMAVGADIERAARQEAEGDILGLRRTAQQDAIDNAARAFGLDIEGRGMANEQMLLEAKLKALDALLAQQGLSPPPVDEGAGGGGGGSVGDAISGLTGAGDGSAQLPGMNDVPDYELGGDGSEPPAGAFAQAAEATRTPQDYSEAYVTTDESGQEWDVYLTPDGWVKVRRGVQVAGG